MTFKSLLRTIWLILRPFDALQNAIGALGVIINLFVSVGAISGTGIIGWLYFPHNTEGSGHNWFPAMELLH